MAIPTAMKEKYNAIMPLIAEFCDARLNDEYKALCLKLLEKLCRKRPSPLLGGKVNSWAAGIVYAIAANNFIFDKANPHSMTAPELAGAFSLAPSTVGNKAAELRKMFDIYYSNGQWLLREYLKVNTAVWTLEMNGFLIDIRQAPFRIQKLAFEKGLIPYIPDESDDDGL
jgi:hypothetical protein